MTNSKSFEIETVKVVRKPIEKIPPRQLVIWLLDNHDAADFKKRADAVAAALKKRRAGLKPGAFGAKELDYAETLVEKITAIFSK
ncbi:MAG: hypothetical protein OXL36_14300 [Bryobacterales bacterium]|nr:hypothetical protein [Bryobacterales bacterium]MDE0293694.1 hypothetical protein [Bryobacterales bacterium]